MLGDGRDDMTAVIAAPGAGAENRQIVAFSRTAGEDNLAGRGADRSGEGFPSGIHSLPGFATHLVGRAAGVAVVLGKPRKHCLERPRVEPGRGMVVEVDGHGSGHPGIRQRDS